MKRLLTLLLVLSFIFTPALSFAASGGFSSGGYRSSGSFSSSRSFSSGGFRSSGSFSGGSTFRSASPNGFTSGSVRSFGSLFKTTPTPRPAPKIAPSTLGIGPDRVITQTHVYHTYSYNPFSGNFFFWLWIFGNHNAKPAAQTVIINNVASTTPATTTEKSNGK